MDGRQTPFQANFRIRLEPSIWVILMKWIRCVGGPRIASTRAMMIIAFVGNLAILKKKKNKLDG